MFDAEPGRTEIAPSFDLQSYRWQTGSFSIFKRVFDVLACLALFPLLLLTAALLLVFNPLLNRGALFYVQDRMGQDCQPFRAFKFRSMVAADSVQRGAFDRLEEHRITRMGRFMRKSRLDELPQLINVLRGDMTMIGPRPDFLAHARVYLAEIPGYRDRLTVRPGISGYAQVVHGYVDGLDGIRRKVSADLYYIRNASVGLDMWIAWRTFLTVIMRRGT